MSQSQNSLRRFFISGASEVRHPLYDYVSQRFFATIPNKLIYPLNEFAFTYPKIFSIEDVFKYLWPGLEDWKQALENCKSSDLYNYILKNLLSDYNMLINKYSLNELQNYPTRPIYIIFYPYKPEFKEGCIDIDNILFYVTLSVNDLKELKELKENFKDIDFKPMVEDYSNKIVCNVLKTFDAKQFGCITNAFYFNILIPKNGNTQFHLESKERKINFNRAAQNNKLLESNFIPRFNWAVNIKKLSSLTNTCMEAAMSDLSTEIRSYSTRTKERSKKQNKFLLNIDPFTITKGKYHWMNYISSNFYSIIDLNVLEEELKLFYDFYKVNYPNHKFFAIVFKLQLANKDIRSCSSLQVSTVNDYDFKELLTRFSHIFLVENFLEAVSEKDESCIDKETGYPVGSFIFSFKALKTIKQTKYENMYISKLNMTRKINEGKDFIKDFDYKGCKIPCNMDLCDWPNIRFSEDFKHAHAYFTFIKNIQKNEKLRLDFDFIINDDNYSATVINRDTDTTLFTFTDTLNNPYDLNDFKRVIIDKNIKKTYILSRGKVILYSKDLQVDYIKPLPEQRYFKPKIITLDFETRDLEILENESRVVNKVKVPICMCVYDGTNSFYFLFKDHNKWINDLMKAFRNSIMKRKYNGYKIYIHNFSHFDSVFMIDVLSRLGEIKKPLFRDNAILKLPFEFTTNNKNKEKYTLTFYDSKLILPHSLRDLSKSFGVENKKDFFPYGFVNDENKFSFDYKGPVPKYEYFLDSLSKNEYNDYCERYKAKLWNLRRELHLYCERDCISLHQIIVKFHKQIHDLLKIDITKYPTLSSIAFSGYRTNFMEKEKIPKILSRLHYTIKESYYGGITEVYKGKGFKINSYDINSLYPSAMLKNPMPVGKPTYFSGDISLINNNPFGFFKVKVSAPLNLNKPTLPMKLKTEDGIRTVFPTGRWTSWYFSEEIKDKLQDGYTFEILEGFLFEKDYIFTEYINLLYKIKCNTDSSDSLYFIAKLLMNALYGRFGLNPEAREVVIVSHEESEKILLERKNVLVIPLLGGKVMISYDLQTEEEINISDISIPISSAIAAYSRIEMSKYIRKYDKNLYYIDTDGIKVDCELDSSEIDSKELGKMKYEYTFKEAVFPGLKVYGGILSKPYKKYSREIVKVKGLKVDISYYHLNSMNNKYNPSIIEQEKWKRYLDKSVILVKSENYTLEINENKREMIFNSWGDFVDTTPLYLNNGVLVKRNPDPLYYLTDLPPSIACLNYFNKIKLNDSYTELMGRTIINPKYEIVSSNLENSQEKISCLDKDEFLSKEDLKAIELDALSKPVNLDEFHRTWIYLDFDSPLQYNFNLEEIPLKRSFIRIDPDSSAVALDEMDWDIEDKAEEIKAIENEELEIFKTLYLDRLSKGSLIKDIKDILDLKKDSYDKEIKIKEKDPPSRKLPPDIKKRNKNEELTKYDLILIAITNLMLILQIGLIETMKLYWILLKFYLFILELLYLFLEEIVIHFLLPTWLIETIKFFWVILQLYWIILRFSVEMVIFIISLLFK